MADEKKSEAQMAQLAYQNLRFLEGADARALRILAEYFDPLAHFRKAGVQNTVVFFGSARVESHEEAVQHLREVEFRIKQGPVAGLQAELKRARMGVHMSGYYEAARELARLITEWVMKVHNNPRFLMVCSGAGQALWKPPIAGQARLGENLLGSISSCRWSRNPTLIFHRNLACCSGISSCVNSGSRNLPKR